MTTRDSSGSSSPSPDEIRAHELYKYFRPPLEDGSSPDQILTAHAQLVAWRLDAERAMITLIDENVQFFVAESTKTLHLDDAHRHDHPDDAIWAGCVRVSKSGRLCEHTIAATPPESGGPACFEIVHLDEDARFNTLDFVAGPPYFKHYAGVPLRTRKGVNIGSMFVIDSRTRPPLSKSDWHFLDVVAGNVIKHLEMIKDQKDSVRSLNMSACMAAYVDPLRLGRGNVETESDGSIRVLGPSREKPTLTHRAADAERLDIYKRAAGWLLQGLDYDESGGGVMFLDTLPPRDDPNGGNDENFANSGGRDSDGSTQESDGDGQEDPGTHKSKSDSDKEHDTQDTEILAHAIQPEEGDNIDGSLLIDTLSPKDLRGLTQHYPDGKLFTFSPRYALVSSSDETSRHPSSVNGYPRETRDARKSDAKRLQRYFPRARQIVLLPVWDTSVSRFVVCIAYHRSKYHHMSYKTEFVFCATFSKTLMAELSKLAVVQANQQKSDFISSISHELRSPLHGILASCDFLDDTNLTQFQQSLVGTADSCARTLLDTINMVLDYSNINRFESTKERVKKDQRNLSEGGRARDLQTSLSTRRTFDIAALIEEVVDSLIAGHKFEDRPKRSGSISTGVPPSAASTTSSGSAGSIDGDRVTVVLDIPARNWTYSTEPGALRRIVLNLVGNALKFTQRGFVHIKIDVDTPKQPAVCPRLILTVTDSGQGISPDYLRNTLYSPFSQESNVTSGTGLGLTLVKSIVRTMGGKIRLDSSLGVGTTASVKIPVIHAPSAAPDVSGNASPANFDMAAERQRSILISAVKVQAPVRTCALFWHTYKENSSAGNKALQLLHSSLVTYLSRWFGLSISPWQPEETYDIVIATFDGLKKLRQLDPSVFTRDNPGTILAVDTATSPDKPEATTVGSTSTVILRCPFGPSKLAQALSSCLDSLKWGQNNHSEDQQQDSVEKPADFDTDKAVIHTSVTTESSKQVQQQSGTANDDSQLSVLPINTKPASENLSIVEAYVETTVPDIPDRQSSGVTLPEETSNPPNSETAMDKTQTPDEYPMTSTIAKSMASYPRMLLVDDNAINLRLLQLYCKKLGTINTHSAENGQQAVEIYEQLLHATPSTAPSVIFMDLSMPVLSGFEATRRIRQSEAKYNKGLENGAVAQRSLIIALTGLASLKDQKEAFAAGVDRYLMKPVKFANLTQILVDAELHR